MQLTHTEENYIKVIHQLSNDGEKIVTTNTLAKHLNTSPAAITDMIQRMYQKRLLTYQKYQGVNITTLGREKAMQILRRHRLWEVFLVKKLKFTWDEVQAVTEELEHIQSEMLIQRLDAYLDYPTYSPHGEPIPNTKGEIKKQSQVTLNQLEVGQKGILVAVKDDSTAFLQYLNKRNIYLGATMQVLDKVAFDESMDISIDSKERTNISLKVSDNLLVVC
jgi:DtxR family Mn-dependent transcriptional regulator